MTTTDDRLAALAKRPKRDKFPARSARILTAGLSAAAILGLSSTITAMSPPQAATSTDTDVAPDQILDPAVLTGTNTVVDPALVDPALVDPALVSPPHAAVPATQQPVPAEAAAPIAATMPVVPPEPTRVVLDVPVAPVQPSARSGGSS
jgi:hypothetical protein